MKLAHRFSKIMKKHIKNRHKNHHKNLRVPQKGLKISKMENFGCAWHEREDKQLIKLFHYKLPIFEIAEFHGRSEKEIERRLNYLGLKNTDNFVWERFNFKLKNKYKGYRDDKSETWEILCETLSEIINEKTQRN